MWNIWELCIILANFLWNYSKIKNLIRKKCMSNIWTEVLKYSPSLVVTIDTPRPALTLSLILRAAARKQNLIGGDFPGRLRLAVFWAEGKWRFMLTSLISVTQSGRENTELADSGEDSMEPFHFTSEETEAPAQVLRILNCNPHLIPNSVLFSSLGLLP